MVSANRHLVRNRSGLTIAQTFLWSDPATHGGVLPTLADPVVVPVGETWIYDDVAGEALNITINGTLLADTTKNLNLTTGYIEVASTGTFQIGNSAADPYAFVFNTYFAGADAAYVAPGNDGIHYTRADGGRNRGLIVQAGGTFKPYGLIPAQPFLKLNGSLAAAATSAALTTNHGWAIGDEIAIGATDYHTAYAPDKRTLTSAAGANVGWAGGLANGRYGVLQYATDAGISTVAGAFTLAGMKATATTPSVIDERAMFANLTRNIRFHGGLDASDADWVTYGHGLHMMFMGLTTVVQMQGVELIRGGQSGILGRYPIHWHENSYNPTTKVYLGDMSNNWVKYCSINESQNRGVTFHGCCGVIAEYNVCYNIKGWCFFSEDATEERNIWIHNCVIDVSNPSTAVLPLPASASFTRQLKLFDGNQVAGTPLSGSGAYWSTNPTNLVEFNYGNHCQGRIFQNAFPHQTWGSTGGAMDSGGNVIIPAHRNHVGFNDNEAMGARSYCYLLGEPQTSEAGGVATNGLKYSPRDNGLITGTEVYVFFRRNQMYKGRLGGYRNFADKPQYTEWIAADNGDMCFSGVVWDGLIDSCLFAGTTGNASTNTSNLALTSVAASSASYHSTLFIKNSSHFNFPTSGPVYPGATNSEVRGGMVRSNDFYLTAGIHSLARHTGNKFHNASPGGWSRNPINDGQNEYGTSQRTVTGVTVANPGVFTTSAAHSLAVNSQVELASTGNVPAPFVARTRYYVASIPTTTTFTLSATSGGAAIQTTDAGTGTIIVGLCTSKRHWNLNGAMVDIPGYWGPAGNYLVFDIPFYTTGLSSSAATTDGSGTRVSTPDRHYGVGQFYNDADTARGATEFTSIAPMKVDQVNSSQVVLATFETYDGINSGGSFIFRTFAPRKDGIYVLTNPGIALPVTYNRMNVGGAVFTGGGNIDRFIVKMPWAGATTRVFIQNITGGTLNVPTAMMAAGTAKELTGRGASLADVIADATGNTVWVEADGVWVRYTQPPVSSIAVTPPAFDNPDNNSTDTQQILIRL